jgi:hypothetical protein
MYQANLLCHVRSDGTVNNEHNVRLADTDVPSLVNTDIHSLADTDVPTVPYQTLMYLA